MKKSRDRKSTKQLYERYKKIKDRNREKIVNQDLQEQKEQKMLAIKKGSKNLYNENSFDKQAKGI